MSTHSSQVLLESSPAHIFGARHESFVFPHFAGPRQELVFALGLTAVRGPSTLLGLSIALVHDHQVVAEQRWTASMLLRHTGLADLDMEEGTGIAIQHLHFNETGLAEANTVQVVAVLTAPDGATWNEILEIPVTFPEQSTELHFPLEGTWWAIQGADWTDQHKAEPISQAYALDFVKLGRDAAFYQGTGAELQDHYSWDAPVYAPASARVAHVIYDMPDMQPGEMPDPAMMQGDARRVLGNAVALSHRKGEFSYLAHLRQGSPQVRVGDHIRRGTLVGHVGNSGHSPGPHLHYHLMNGPNLFLDQALPVRLCRFWAGGLWHAESTALPTRMIVRGPARG